MSAERKFLIDGIKQGIRVDGRDLLDRRHVSVECGVLPACFGSARVCLVNSGTDVLAAVKAELLDAEHGSIATAGNVTIHVASWSAASSGAAQSARQADASVIAATVQRCLVEAGGLPLDTLVEGGGAFHWLLHVDVTVCADGGGLVDAVALAAYAALADTVLPGITTTTTPGDGEEEGGVEAQVDELPSAGRKVDVSAVPLPVTLHAVAGQLLVDASSPEEAAADGSITLAVTPHGAIASMTSRSTPGTLCFSPTLVDLAIKAAAAINAASPALRATVVAAATPLPQASGSGTADPGDLPGGMTREGLPLDPLAAVAGAIAKEGGAKGHLA